MLGWLKTNRLKIASLAAVSGDIFMGLAGGMGLLHASFQNTAYAALTLGGFFAVAGHAALMIWGKGARAKNQTTAVLAAPPVFLKPLYPWRYPLDCAFALFIVTNVFYIIAGAYLNLPALCISGMFAVAASALGWLWPQDKLLFGLRSMQITSLCYSLATLNHFIAGFSAMNIWIILSAVCYLTCNAILFTVRKENQSAFTQEHENTAE